MSVKEVWAECARAEKQGYRKQSKVDISVGDYLKAYLVLGTACSAVSFLSILIG